MSEDIGTGFNFSEDKLELLDLLLADEGMAETAVPNIPPRPQTNDPLPLSFSQQRLWFLTQLEPESAAYHISVAYRLNGLLDVAALSKSLLKIVQRHESLRTIFGQADGAPYQAILPEMPLHLTRVDLRQTPKGELEDELQQQTAIFNSRPFSLTSGPLLRVGLFQLDLEQYVLAITKHHIISDGSSQAIFLQELSRLYAGFVAGEAALLPELPVQYADFAVWQQKRLSGKLLADQIGYWREQLLGAPPVLELPTARPRPAKQTFRSRREVLVLPEQLSHSLNELSRHENGTLFMTLLAAFQLLLRRLAGQEDVVVGTPIAGRNRAEIENLMGFFINNLVIRTAVSDDLTFQELLAQVREKALAAYDHQDVPFEKLLEVLKPERDLSRTPIFQIFFNMLNVDLYQLDLAGLDVEQVSRTDREAREAKFDLTLYVSEEKGTIYLQLTYNADLFTVVQMREFLQQYQLLLRQIVVRPHWEIAKYSLVTPTARQLLPDPIRPLPEAWLGAVHTLFAEQAGKAPAQTALIDANSSWQYADLEKCSNQLAHHFRGSGIGSGDVVAIYADRSAALVWAILGTLKAGAAFLILDPAYPAARLQKYLEAAQPRGWIQIQTAPTPSRGQAVSLPKELEKWIEQAAPICQITLPPTPTAVLPALNTQPTIPPAVLIDPDDLAYIIFTSGTTGQPKGIQGRHSPLAHFFTWQIETFGLKPADRFSMLSGLAHDPLLRDIFTPLLAGATLHIPTSEERMQPGQLARWLAQNKISVAHLTPTLGEVVGMGAVGETAVSLPTLRYAFFGGDRLTRQNVHQLRALSPSVTCVNFYGASETPQAMAYHPVSIADIEAETAENVLPIGQGIADVQLLVLNRDQQLAGVNELGEIYIRTPYLAQGYLDDDSLTEEWFVVSPWRNDPADICYRTGDWGRYTAAGDVVFYGRSDRQVKIRGFRVEMAEIERSLQQLDGVARGIVVARPNSDGQMQLAAYVMMAEKRPFSSKELRTALAALLPTHMVPTAFIQLEELPITPNGKIDYARLPAPDQAALIQQIGYAAPTDGLENQLVNIWEAVLKVQPIGIHDNYFDLGGYSLQTISLFAEMEKVFKKRIPLATIFQAPTIAALAAVMRQNGESPTWSSVVPISPSGGKRPFFCVHGGAGHVYHYRALAQHLESDQPFYGIQPGKNNGSQTDNDVKSMATAYLQEIQQVQPHGPYYLGGFCFGGIIAFEMAQQLTQLGEEVGLVAIIDALSPTYNGQLIPPAASARLITILGQGVAQRRDQTLLAKIFQMGSNVKRVLTVAITRMQQRWRRLGETGDKLLLRLYEKLNQPLPHRLQNHQMLAAARSTRKQYVPKIYSGDLVVFRRDDIDEQIPAALGWDALSSQTVHIHEIMGTHLGLLEEPYVQDLARQLQVSLVKSRSSTPLKIGH
ncbi:MAG: amino acid adenylation domain-containing protein [Chloroflexi bacterium]|nr:amino acid adenylation domain-containing protein [Chloroflexota bacterium]